MNRNTFAINQNSGPDMIIIPVNDSHKSTALFPAHRIQYFMLTDITALIRALILCASYFIRFMTVVAQVVLSKTKNKSHNFRLYGSGKRRYSGVNSRKHKAVFSVIVVDAG